MIRNEEMGKGWDVSFPVNEKLNRTIKGAGTGILTVVLGVMCISQGYHNVKGVAASKAVIPYGVVISEEYQLQSAAIQKTMDALFAGNKSIFADAITKEFGAVEAVPIMETARDYDVDDLETEVVPAVSEVENVVPTVNRAAGESVSDTTFVCDGFLCDASGMIIDCSAAMIDEGILRLPSDVRCIGIAAGALDSIVDSVTEVYIPANITSIEADAFALLENMIYVEVHPDNSVYGSSFGVLCQK